MIKIENIRDNIIKVTVPDTLRSDDFQAMALQVDRLIHHFGKVRLLIDATGFNGWENMAAFEQHVAFVRSHHLAIERAAIIAGHTWHHWIAAIVRLFVRPEIRVYDKHEEDEAVRWIAS